LETSLPAGSTSRWPHATATVLLLLVGGTFLFSAAAKLWDVDTFRWALIDAGVENNTLAAWGARIFAGGEAAIGLLLLLRIAARKVALPAAAALLVIFSVYLGKMLLESGNAGDCGCFGDWLPMAPLPALLKNLFLLLAVFLLYRIEGWPEWTRNRAVAGGLLIVGMVVPLIIFPPKSGKAEKLELQKLSTSPIQLAQGRQVVAFMSLGCPHCREAARIFGNMQRTNPKLPITMILSGNKEEAVDFFAESHSENVTHLFEPSPEKFIALAGRYVPAIYYVENGAITRRVSYRTLTRPALEHWAFR
jgi:uncharacterized membrane protein YphA (DoxX/SURF4 family)